MTAKIKGFFEGFSPNGKTVGYRTVLFIMSFLALAISSAGLGLLGLYFSTGEHGIPLFSFYMKEPKLILLNILPYFIISLFVWFISNRPWIAFLCSGTVCLVYSFCNYWKLVGRNDPIIAEDLTLIGEALKMTEEGYATFTWQMYLVIFAVLFITLLLALFVRGKMPHFSLRIALPCLLALICIPLYTGVYTSDKVYSSFPSWDKLNPWFATSSYVSRGGIYPFINSIPDAIPQVPEGYEKEEVEGLIDSYEDDSVPEEKRANVMFVMLEAFSDLSEYTDLITEADPYADFHKLQNESYSGELVTNIFAGGTINSERCVLTGFSDLSSFRRKSWSYARYFGDMGYTVNGSHAGYESFYNRVNVNKNLGFENYNFIENYFEDIASGVPMDDVFLPEICRLFKKDMASGKNVFSFNVTYQNHGPYHNGLYPDSKIYVPKGNLSDEDHAIINNYLRGIEKTGEYMLDAVDEFRKTKEPVILVFFGDHKPWLGEGGTTYKALGIDIFNEAEQSFYNHYNTEYLIWANDAAKTLLENDFVGEGPTISPCYLMNVLFSQCGWEGPSYMKLSNEVMAKMPVVSSKGRIMQDGELVAEAEISKENAELLSKFRKAQYYLARNSKQ